jgi:hypothetical protein
MRLAAACLSGNEGAAGGRMRVHAQALLPPLCASNQQTPTPALMLMLRYSRMPCSRSSLFLLGALADATGGLRGG